MQTIGQWLQTLPRGHREFCLKNSNQANHMARANNLAGAILMCCTWSATKGGAAYWGALYDWAGNPQHFPIPKLPKPAKQ